MSERKRAGDARTSMLRGLNLPPRPTPQPVPEDNGEATPLAAPVQPAAAPAAKVKPVTTKFTANLDADTAAEFDGLALAARRKLGRRVDKLDLLKAFVRLAADDASLRDQIISEIEQSGR